MSLEEAKSLVEEKAKKTERWLWSSWQPVYEIYLYREGKTLRADTLDRLAFDVYAFCLNVLKDSEMREAARKYARSKGKYGMLLPTKGLVAFILESSPAWKEWCKGWDNRGSGNAIGRRASKLRILRGD